MNNKLLLYCLIGVVVVLIVIGVGWFNQIGSVSHFGELFVDQDMSNILGAPVIVKSPWPEIWQDHWVYVGNWEDGQLVERYDFIRSTGERVAALVIDGIMVEVRRNNYLIFARGVSSNDNLLKQDRFLAGLADQIGQFKMEIEVDGVYGSTRAV